MSTIWLLVFVIPANGLLRRMGITLDLYGLRKESDYVANSGSLFWYILTTAECLDVQDVFTLLPFSLFVSAIF